MLKILLILPAIIFPLLWIYARVLERSRIFLPVKEITLTPDVLGLGYEDIYFTAEDKVKLNGWFISQPQAEYTVLFLHGNGGNISRRVEKALFLHELGLNLFLVDYRGYGNSQGRPSEKGMYKDALAACRYLSENRAVHRDKIIVYGESLGGAAAIECACQPGLAGLIVEGTFCRGIDLARKAYPWIPAFFYSIKFDSCSAVKNLALPKLFFHSKNDEVVPFAQGSKLYQAAPDPKTFVTTQGRHTAAFIDDRETFRTALKKFISGLKDQD